MEDTEYDVSSMSDSELDAAWNDETEVTPNETEQETATEADPPTESDTPAETPAESEEQPKAEHTSEAAEENKPLTFTLKHFEEIKTVDADEVVKLAQQGMDYDRIRTERDQLREYRKEADPAMNLLKSYADQSGVSISAYIDLIHKQELMASGLDEINANERIAIDKEKAAQKADREAKARDEAQQKAAESERTAREAEEKRQQERKQADMNRFLQKYPDIKAEDIPKEVWTEVTNGETLTSAYTMYRNRTLESELAAERQNRENTQKSTGSMTTKGAKAGIDAAIDAAWYDES